MNDRFKFRFWRYNPVEEKQVRVSSDLMDTDGYAQPYELFDGSAWCDYDDCICEQCTGLKDKNGKLIYEGDIVKLSSDREVVCPVVWDDEETGFCVKYKKELYRFNTYKKYHLIEVIGNIHENADLLEFKND